MTARDEFDGQERNQADSTGAGSERVTVSIPSPPRPLDRILLSDEEAAMLLHCSRRRFHELRSEPWMAAAPPLALGPRQLRWVRSEIEAAIANAPRVRELSQPAALARARIDAMKAKR